MIRTNNSTSIADTVEEFWNLSQVGDLHHDQDTVIIAKQLFCSEFGLNNKHVTTFGSARLSLRELLKVVNIDKSKDEVLVLAFNCDVVIDAVIDAGFKPIPYDFSDKPGFYDWDKILEKLARRPAGIIISHLFGMPVNFKPIINYCRLNDIIIIEDCAHCLGASIDNKSVGSLGDASIFSFNYDKPISLAWGGLLVINSPELFDTNALSSSRSLDYDDEFNQLILFSKYIDGRRRLIGRDQRMTYKIKRKIKRLLQIYPQHGSYQPPYTSFGILRSAMLIQTIKGYNEVKKIRNFNADLISKGKEEEFWPIHQGTKHAALKLKFNAKSAKHANNLSRKLINEGIRAGRFNWPDINPIFMLESNPLSYKVAQEWIDIPCHQNLTARHLDVISNHLKNF